MHMRKEPGSGLRQILVTTDSLLRLLSSYKIEPVAFSVACREAHVMMDLKVQLVFEQCTFKLQVHLYTDFFQLTCTVQNHVVHGETL